MEQKNVITLYETAAETIKTAILQELRKALPNMDDLSKLLK